MRSFIALSLSEEAKTELGRISALLAQRLPSPKTARWVKPESMHLTLKFLGETAVGKLPAIAAALDQLAAHERPFTLRLDTVGCFPNANRPRVVWVGLQGEVRRLTALQKSVDRAAAALGWRRDKRPFHPHLTLARIKDGRRLQAVRWAVDVRPVRVSVTAVQIIESQLHPAGAIYTIRHTSQL